MTVTMSVSALWPETEAVPSYYCPRQLLISKVKFPISRRIVSAKPFPDSTDSQCKNPKTYSFISTSLSINLKTKDNCFWFEQSDASLAKIGKILLSFMSLIKTSFMNFWEVFEI